MLGPQGEINAREFIRWCNMTTSLFITFSRNINVLGAEQLITLLIIRKYVLCLYKEINLKLSGNLLLV